MDSDDDTSVSNDRGKVAKATRFLKSSKEWSLLKSWFVAGKIKPTDKPADVKARHKCYNKYTATQFCSQFNKLKKELLVSHNGKVSCCYAASSVWCDCV